MAFKFTRREVFRRLAAVVPAVGFIRNSRAFSGTDDSSDNHEISRNCECIHQEVEFKATRARIYQALTDEKQFGKVTELSIPGATTTISPQLGGEFSLFGGVIIGRHLELVPNERLVHAWREKDWLPGVYSVVKFQLSDAGSQTRLVFDHTGFPQGRAESLARGWKSHYWEPLQKYLA